MARVPALNARKVIQLLKRAGFREDHKTGSHLVMIHVDGRRVVIPVHSKDIPRGTLLAILRAAQITLD